MQVDKITTEQAMPSSLMNILDSLFLVFKKLNKDVENFTRNYTFLEVN